MKRKCIYLLLSLLMIISLNNIIYNVQSDDTVIPDVDLIATK